MSNTTQQHLFDVFRSYTGEPLELDSVHWTRMLRVSGFYVGHLSIPETDLIFARVKPKLRIRIDFDTFLTALEHLALRLQEPVENLAAKLRPAPIASSRPTSSRGPTRFYYDTSTYTGVHAKGGPVVIDRIYDGEVTGKIDLSQLCDRSVSDVRGRKVGLAPIPGFSTHEDVKRMNSRPASREQDQQKDVSSILNTSSPATGPSRFYYDQSSYTGTHRFIDHKQPNHLRPVEFAVPNATQQNLDARQKELARRQEELRAQQRQLEKEQRELVAMQQQSVQFKSTVKLSPKSN